MHVLQCLTKKKEKVPTNAGKSRFIIQRTVVADRILASFAPHRPSIERAKFPQTIRPATEGTGRPRLHQKQGKNSRISRLNADFNPKENNQTDVLGRINAASE